jgi:aspartate racemase
VTGARKSAANSAARPGRPRAAKRVIGVLGGMGPLATADFYTKLVRLTPARTDQEHPRVIIDSNPKIPDRTAGLFGQGPDPTPDLIATARGLVRAGADVIAIPCNSAHAFLGAIRDRVPVPVLDMMHEVAAAAAALKPRPQVVGLLATPGTIRARLYHRTLAQQGIAVVDSTPAEDARMLDAIKSVKAGDLGTKVRDRVRAAARALIDRGAGAIILGCTELPLVMAPNDVPVPVLDGTEILAAAAVREAFSGDGLAKEFSRPLRRWDARTHSLQHHAGARRPARRR